MKPVSIEYVRAERWRTVWGIALFVVLATVGATGWQWLQRSGDARELDGSIAELKAQIQRAQTPVPAVVDPRQASTEQAIRLLRADYNKVFAAIENLKEPGARLRSMTLEVSSNTLRLEYDLESVVKASAVTEALNGGYDGRPWKLESVSAIGGPAIAGAAQAAHGGLFRGVWVVRIDSL